MINVETEKLTNILKKNTSLFDLNLRDWHINLTENIKNNWKIVSIIKVIFSGLNPGMKKFINL